MYEQIINELDNSENVLLSGISGLTEQQLKYKISPQIWSIHECLEHIVITEIGVYRILMQHTEGVADSGAEKIGKEKIKRILDDRTKKTESPDSVKPIGRFSSLEELISKFKSNRERLKEALKNKQVVFDDRVIMHPALGEMTKKDWLYFLIHHAERHCRQIDELKSEVLQAS